MTVKQLKFGVVLFIASSTIYSNQSFAQSVDYYFNSDDSTKFSNEHISSSNRDDRDPVITLINIKTDRLERNQPDAIDIQEVKKIIAVHQKRNDKKYTIDRLELLAEDLTRYYRSKGFILAKVFFPEQGVINKTLSLDVVYGTLEKVTAHNHDHYSSDRLTRPFKDITGLPIEITSLESSLIELQQYPGVSVQSRFREGESLGSTQIDVFVKDEKITDFNFSFDNYGSEYTGSMRGTLTADVYNVVDMADQLSINVLATVDPTNSVFWGASYQFRWSPYFDNPNLNRAFRHGLLFKFGHQQSEYIVGGDFELAKIRGEANTSFVGVSKYFYLQNDFKWSAGLTLSKKQATSYQNDRPQVEDKLSIVTTTSTLLWNDHLTSPAANAIQLDIHTGLPGFAGSYSNGDSRISRVSNTNQKAPMDFVKYNLSLVRNQKVGPYEVLGKIRMQYTDDLLLSSELANLGGATSVRGYASSDFSGDKATILTFEVSGRANANKFSIPISDLKLAAFVDHGIGTRLSPDLDVLAEAEMTSVGGYAQFLKDGKFSSKIELAMPLNAIGDSDKNQFEVLFNFDRGF